MDDEESQIHPQFSDIVRKLRMNFVRDFFNPRNIAENSHDSTVITRHEKSISEIINEEINETINEEI